MREVVFFEQLFSCESIQQVAHFEDSNTSSDLSARLSYERIQKEEEITNVYFNGPSYDKDFCIKRELFYVGSISHGLST